MEQVKIRYYYLILDCPFNRAHYAQLIGRVLPNAPLFARCKMV